MSRLLCSALLLALSCPVWAVAPATPADSLPPGARLRIGTTRFRHGDVVRGLAFSPDGKLLASASHDQTVSVWEVPTGRERFRLRGHGADVLCVAYAPDGQLIASGGADGSVRLWGVQGDAAGRELDQFTLKADAVEAVAFAPHGRVLAVAGDDGTVALFEVASRRLLHLFAQDRGVRCLAWSADSTWLAASGGAKNAVNLYDAGTRRLLGAFGDEAVQCLAFAPRGFRLASWEVNGPLRLWDAGKGSQLHQASPDRMNLRGPDAVVYQVAFSRDGRTLLAGSVSGTVDVYDAGTLKRTRQLSGHRGRVTALAVSPVDDVVASGGSDGTIRLWDGKGTALTPAGTPDAAVVSVSATDRAEQLAVVLASGEVLLVGRDTGRVLPHELGRPVEVATLNADGRSLALVSAGALELWDVRTGKVARSEKANPPYTGAAFSADGKTLVTLRSDGTMTLCDPTGKRLRDGQGKERGVAPVVAPDGRMVAGVGRTVSIPLWGGITAKQLRPLAGHRGGTLAATFSADGRQLASGGRDRMLRLWDLTSGKEARLPAGHAAWVCAVAASADGRLLASGTTRGTVHLWSARTGRWVRDLEGHRGPVSALVFVDGSKALVSASRDTSVLIWATAKIDERNPEPIPLTAVQREVLWQEMRDLDQAVASLATQKLARDPAGAVPLVRDRVKAVDGKAIAKWLAQLDDSDFGVRDAAFKALARLGRNALGPVQKVMDSKPSLEKYRRAEELLNKMMAPAATAEHARALRAVEVLETIGTAQARRVLEALAAGDPDAALTRAAESALGRLKK